MNNILFITSNTGFLQEGQKLLKERGAFRLATGTFTAGQVLSQNRELAIVIVDAEGNTGPHLADILRAVDNRLFGRESVALYCVGGETDKKYRDQIQSVVRTKIQWVPQLYSVTLQ